MYALRLKLSVNFLIVGKILGFGALLDLVEPFIATDAKIDLGEPFIAFGHGGRHQYDTTASTRLVLGTPSVYSVGVFPR